MSASRHQSEYYPRPRKRHSLYANAAAMHHPMDPALSAYPSQPTSAYGGSEVLGQGPIEDQIADAQEQIRLYREEQRELHRQRLALEAQQTKDARFEQGRVHLAERLSQAIAECQERAQHARMELKTCQQLAEKFSHHLQAIDHVRPEAWRDHGVGQELDRALLILEDADNAMQKGQRMVHQLNRRAPYSAGAQVVAPVREKGFLYWLRCGFAFALPFVAALVVAVILLLNAIQGNF